MTCPRPDKTRYLNRAEAKARCKRDKSLGHRLAHAYLCGCGFWHVSRGDAENRAIARKAAR